VRWSSSSSSSSLLSSSHDYATLSWQCMSSFCLWLIRASRPVTLQSIDSVCCVRPTIVCVCVVLRNRIAMVRYKTRRPYTQISPYIGHRKPFWQPKQCGWTITRNEIARNEIYSDDQVHLDLEEAQLLQRNRATLRIIWKNFQLNSMYNGCEIVVVVLSDCSDS